MIPTNIVYRLYCIVCMSLLSVLVVLQNCCIASSTIYPRGVTISSSNTTNGAILFLSNSNSTIYLIDHEGNEIHRWDSPSPFLFDTLVKPLADNKLLVLIKQGLHDKFLAELDWEGNIARKTNLSAYTQIHHDFQRLPNGNTLFLAGKFKEVPELYHAPIIDDIIVEIDPKGEPVWTWSMVDHVPQFAFSPEALKAIAEWKVVGGEDYAWLFHLNSIQAIPPNPSALLDSRFSPGNILVSCRNGNLIFIIDKTTGNVVWTMHNETIGQHHVSMIPDGFPNAGKIIAFDNGGFMGFPRIFRLSSCVRMVDPIDGTARTVYDAWNSQMPLQTFQSQFHGSVQVLENGHLFITESGHGRIFEVSKKGEIVWEFVSPHKAKRTRNFEARIYRAYKLKESWLQGRQLDNWYW